MSSIMTRRKELGITQQALASSVGVSRSTVAMWDRGASLPRAAILPKIAAILECRIDDLLAEQKDAS